MISTGTNWRIVCIVATLALLCLPSPAAATPDGSCNTIEAALTLDDGDEIYFLSGGEYIKYNLERESEEEVGSIEELGLGRRANQAAAAFTLANGNLVIIKGCRYFKYYRGFFGALNFQEEGRNFGGLPCSPDAAVTLAGDILVFKGCDVWKFSTNTGTFRLDSQLPHLGLPCGLDAAVRWGLHSQQAIFIKGTRFWKFNNQMTGPFHTDDLDICSWYLCGEADWMGERNNGSLQCNGDTRLCELRLSEVTLPGLHNAGSGFNGGFGFMNCWVRNHDRSILEQLRLGIRYLDIDSGYVECGVVGTNHNLFCGGSVCRMLKQTREFLGQNPHEVVALNFNHQMQDTQVMIPALTRQLERQLGPMLNNKFRLTGEQRWPKLSEAVRSNQRVFVFYTPAVHDPPFSDRFYRPINWIHKELWIGSTWRRFNVDNSNCSQIVSMTAERCQAKQYRDLVEVSVVPTPEFGSCINELAQKCRHFLHAVLRACEPHRYRHNKSPNVLLVDYPERESDSPNSVFNAVYHQNVRNIHRHRQGDCQVRVDAAVRRPSADDQALFFVGSKVVIYSQSSQAQIEEIEIPGVSSVDAAYISQDNNIIVTKGCESLPLNSLTLEPLATNWTTTPSCGGPFDAADVWGGSLIIFKGCSDTRQGHTPENLSLLGLPCDVDAALKFGGKTSVFKGNDFWVRRDWDTTFSYGGHTLDWTIDAVVC